MKRLFILILAIAVQLHAATNYVSITGNNSNDGSVGSPWLTIDFAADNSAAGDTVRVQPGVYEERVTPGVSGTSGSPITFFADGGVTNCGWDISSKNYLRIIGFIVDTDQGACTKNNTTVLISGANTGLEFWHNTFRNSNFNGIRLGASDGMTNCIFVGNVCHTMGIGNFSGTAISIRGRNNFIAYNEVYDVDPDAFNCFGTDNRFVGNYTHGMLEDGAGHPDIFQTGSSDNGFSRNLFENTLQIGNGTLGNEHAAQFSHGQAGNCTVCPDFTNNIIRGNIWHNLSSGTVGINQTEVAAIRETRYYHNTTADAVTAAGLASTRYGIAWSGDGTANSFIHNNIEYDSWGSSATTSLEVFYVEGGLTINYNLAFDPDGSVTFAAPFSTQANAYGNSNPDFVDFANDNFRLGGSSGAAGNGGPLTTVATASGSGTSFDTPDYGGGFFLGDDATLDQYGGNLIVGDKITVGTDQLTISSISGNTITVTASFTWAEDDPVFWGWDTTPDIGAYPFGMTPLSAATIAANGNDYTVTPNGDTRFVVFFVDGVPSSVDNVSPYTATIASGTVTARAYPLYASATTSVLAEESEGGEPANATGRIMPLIFGP